MRTDANGVQKFGDHGVVQIEMKGMRETLTSKD